MSASKKLGLRAVSSMEAEVVTDEDRFPECSWFRYFYLAQDNETKEEAMMKCNERCMLLHKNHPFYIKKGIKHVNT